MKNYFSETNKSQQKEYAYNPQGYSVQPDRIRFEDIVDNRDPDPPPIYTYKGEERDFVEAYKKGDPIFRDIWNWAADGVEGPTFFKVPSITSREPRVEFKVWRMIVGGLQAPPVQEAKKVRSYRYYFATVLPDSICMIEGKSEEPHDDIHGQYMASYARFDTGKGVVPSNQQRDTLYQFEVDKAVAYMSTTSKILDPNQNEWFYRLYMYHQHQKEIPRIAEYIIGVSGRIISYGDAVGTLRVQARPVTYYDKSPSHHAINVVNPIKADTLIQLTKKKKNLLVLSYTYEVLTHEEKLILQRSKAKVFIWSSVPVADFPYGTSGVYANFPLQLYKTPIDKTRSYMAFTENFSMVERPFFLDEGDASRAYALTGFFPFVEAHEEFGPDQYYGLPVRKTRSLGDRTPVCHSLDVLRRYLPMAPYFVPAGRAISKILVVSRPMIHYRTGALYCFRPTFPLHTEHEQGLVVARTEAGTYIVFVAPFNSPSLSVTHDVSSSGGSLWVRRSNNGFVIESNHRYDYVYDKDSFMSVWTDLSKNERKELRALSISSFNKEFEVFMKWLGNT
jgi:hypothetical protein